MAKFNLEDEIKWVREYASALTNKALAEHILMLGSRERLPVAGVRRRRMLRSAICVEAAIRLAHPYVPVSH